MSFNTPILLLTFTRLDTTVKVFEQIKKQKPKYLFWASDGPRADNEKDVERIAAVKAYITNEIDWDCDLKTLFRAENLGCGVAPYSAITWFFEHVEQGIILEDDCLPLEGFFEFCESMLNHYQDDESMYEISGTNLQGEYVRGKASHYFSNYGGIWGWATWARAWRKYDYQMKGIDTFLKNSTLKEVFANKDQQIFWATKLQNASKLGSWWDYQWLYTIWSNNGICIVPNANLIKNIGFNSEGTHTLNEPEWYSKLTNNKLKLTSIIYPDTIKIDVIADDFQFYNTIQPKISTINKVKNVIRAILK